MNRYFVGNLLVAVLWLAVLSSNVFAGDFRDLAIAIDVGHSAKDGGARSSHGVPEYAYNRIFAEELYRALLDNGYSNAFIINSQGNLQGKDGLHARTELANKKADLMISIHHDSVGAYRLKDWKFDGKKERYCERFKGYAIFVSDKNPQFENSLYLANMLSRNLIKAGLRPAQHHEKPVPGGGTNVIDKKKGIYKRNLWVIKATDIPSILFEVGVISSRDEERKLASAEYRQGIVKSLVNTMTSYTLKNVWESNPSIASFKPPVDLHK